MSNKIFILPIETEFQPKIQVARYPPHNRDFGIEQDFLHYLLRNPELTSADAKSADWHYLPVFWTRWHVNHGFAKTGRAELQAEVQRTVQDDTKTFTICQYADGPLVSTGSMKVFLGSRKTAEGLDVPLLCAPHRPSSSQVKKKYLASFVGRFDTHPLRRQMQQELGGRDDIFLFDGNESTGFRAKRWFGKFLPFWSGSESQFFVRKMLESCIALCPRGQGGGSFRFYEAMQLGVVPYLIGDIDVRPFKEFINWGEMSLFSTEVSEVATLLQTRNEAEWIKMGNRAAQFFQDNLAFGKWCKYLVRELGKMS